MAAMYERLTRSSARSPITQQQVASLVATRPCHPLGLPACWPRGERSSHAMSHASAMDYSSPTKALAQTLLSTPPAAAQPSSTPPAKAKPEEVTVEELDLRAEKEQQELDFFEKAWAEDQKSSDVAVGGAVFLGGFMLSSALSAEHDEEYWYPWCGPLQRVATVACANMCLLSASVLVADRLMANSIVQAAACDAESAAHKAADSLDAEPSPYQLARGRAPRPAAQAKRPRKVRELLAYEKQIDEVLPRKKLARARYLLKTVQYRRYAIRGFLLAIPVAFVSIALRQLITTACVLTAVLNLFSLIGTGVGLLYAFYTMHVLSQTTQNEVEDQYKEDTERRAAIEEEKASVILAD